MKKIIPVAAFVAWMAMAALTLADFAAFHATVSQPPAATATGAGW